MKTLCLTLVSLTALTANAVNAADPLPNTGTYFITSVSSEEALQPEAASPGQNVFLMPLTNSGAQKWTITRKIDPATKKPTNRYTVKVAGDADGLDFSPHPVQDRTAIIGSGANTVFMLESDDAGTLVKLKNGDAMYVQTSPPPSKSEVRFGANDGSGKFRWKFIPAS